VGPLVAVLIVALLGPQSGGAQGQAGSAAQTQTPGTQDQRPPANLPAQAGKLPVSVEQIKKDLEKAPTLKLAEPPPPPVVEPEQGTTFKVRVEEKYFKLPTFAETLNVGRGYPPSGGLYNYEIMQMITPPGFRGSEPYTNLEVLQLAAASLASALAVKGVVAGVRHLRAEYRTWQEGQAHVEVEQDLADYNRRVAEQADAGSTAASSAKDPPDKKDKKADAKKTDKKDDKKPPDKKPPDKIGG
jgi:hypothetical protein